MQKSLLCQVVEIIYALAVALMTGKWVIPHIGACRGYRAIGGEYVLVLMVYWMSYKMIGFLFDLLGRWHLDKVAEESGPCRGKVIYLQERMEELQVQKPVFKGRWQVCIRVDDVENAFRYYERILGAVPDSHEAENGTERMSGLMKVPGTRTAIELVCHSCRRRKAKISAFRNKDVQRNGGHMALKVTDIKAAYEYIRRQQDVTLLSAGGGEQVESFSFMDKYEVQWKFEQWRQ